MVTRRRSPKGPASTAPPPAPTPAPASGAAPAIARPITAKELLLFAPLYVTFAFVQLRAKLFLTPAWFDGQLESNHAQLLQFTYTNNEQSRILQFYVPEVIRAIFGVSVPDAYLVQRAVFVFVGFVVMHAFFRAWFEPLVAAGGTALQAAAMPLSYMNDLQESAPLLMVMFVVCLWTIRERKAVGYAIALLVGAMVNETVLVLASVHFFYGVEELPRSRARLWATVRAAARTTLLTLPAFGYTLVIRYITRDNPHLGGAWHLPDNLHGFATTLQTNPLHWFAVPYSYLGLVFGPIWIYPYLSWREKPLFLRCASLMVPIFVGAHMLTGIISEVRQMLPLGAVLIPMSLLTLDRRAGRKA